MRKKVFFLIILIEAIICILICLKINNKQYDSWVEIDAYISDVLITGDVSSFRSNKSISVTIMVKYLDKAEIIRMEDYKYSFDKGDTILIKYNPLNIKEIIYLPYEKNRVLKERIRIVFVFVGIILVSLYIWNSKCNDEPKHYWFDDVKKY